MGLDWRNVLKLFLRKVLEYPLLDLAENSTLVACLKSSVCVHILWNLNSWDFIRPANVCLGWKLCLCKSACVSVALLYFFSYNFWKILVIWNMEVDLSEHCGKLWAGSFVLPRARFYPHSQCTALLQFGGALRVWKIHFRHPLRIIMEIDWNLAAIPHFNLLDFPVE